MPWHMQPDHTSCPAGKPFAVIKDSDGSVAGCHPSKKAAQDQMAALYANETKRGAMSTEALPARLVSRMFTVDDLHVRQDGTGRVVEAYAAAFAPVRAEISDIDGHYYETLNPTSFNRTLAHKGLDFRVLFNHGLTVNGEPNPAATMPIGVPVEIHSDEKGVFTATRYLDNPLADWTLDAIKAGAIRAQSFSGRFTRSVKSWPEGRRSGVLPLITRDEVEMREYGPAVFAAYTDAAILGTRAEMFVRALLETPPDKRVEWLSQFEGFSTPLLTEADPEEPTTGTPTEGPADQVDDPHDSEHDEPKHSSRPISVAARAKAFRITHGLR